jgi:hypothetical protein
MSSWEANHYQLQITADGSPSLRFLGGEHQELMHHSGGAYSETMQIYGTPLDLLAGLPAPAVLSLGLGLGYNEFLVARWALQNKSDIFLDSFEADGFLSENFCKYVSSQAQDKSISEVYDDVLHFMRGELPGEAIKQKLYTMKQTGRWRVFPALSSEHTFDRQYNCYLYDAFSAKTTPSLWQEDFLKSLLENTPADCLFTTYACTGNLKRALKATGFTLHERPGFQGKRDSILASKGLTSRGF